MKKKTARVVTSRPADVDEFLRVLTINVWMCVSAYFPNTQSHHCVAVTIKDRNTGQIVLPTPHMIGIMHNFAGERERLESSAKKCDLLLANPERFTSSQCSPDSGEHGAIRIGDRIIGIAGLGGRTDEAIGLVTAKMVWGVSQVEWVDIAYRVDNGPNMRVTHLEDLFEQLSKYLAVRGLTLKTFVPDFQDLGKFKTP